MSIPATAATLDLLDRLMVCDEIWVQSADEGRAVAEHILSSQSPIVLLYGPARAGSTEFMQRWVVPVLSQWTRVSYHPASEAGTFLQTVEEGSIHIWDGFERCLADGSNDELRHLGLLTAESRTRKFVLVLQEDYLSRLFQAREVVPAILEDMFAIPAMPPAKFIEGLARTTAGLHVTLSEEFVAALSRDLDAVRTRAALGPELVAIVAFELYRCVGATGELSKDEYVSRDGLTGILAGHIDFLFESLPAGINPDVGWAVLQEVVRTGIGVPTDLADVANRFDVDVDVAVRVAAWLENDRRVLRANPEGGHDVVPALLARGVEHRARRLDEATEHCRSLLRQGVRQFIEYHLLLPEQTFRKINAQRSAILVSDEEARLMLKCALAYIDVQNGDALKHWLRRVQSPDATIEILLDGLFDSRADIRERAARCLGAFNTQDARDQLHLVALRDPVEAVRAAAVDALSGISTPQLRSALTQETLDPNSPYRLQAIDALRIFTDEKTVHTLVRVVEGTGLGHEERARLRAIDVLGRHGTPQSVAALATIAVHDVDAGDSQAAATALGRVGSEEAAGVALAAVRTEARKVRPPLASPVTMRALANGALHVGLAIAVLIGNFIVHGLILFVIGRRRPALLLTAGEAVAVAAGWLGWPGGWMLALATMWAGVLVPMRILLLERKDRVVQLGLRRALSLVLFAFGCVSVFLWLHGLASALIRRVKRGMILTAFQASAVCLIVSSTLLTDDVSIGHRDISVFAWATVATGLLSGLGYVLLLGTYLLGVGSAFLDLFAWPGRRELGCRIDGAYKRLLGNPHGSAVLLQQLAGSDPRSVRWGQTLAQRYRSAVHDDLTRLWTAAVPPVKDRIFSVMARRPDARSVEFLRGVSRSTGMKGRLHAALAVWTYRFSIWPKSLLLFTTLAVLVLVLYTTALWDLTEHNPWALMRTAQQSDDDAFDAIERLKAMSRSSEQQLSAAATTSLQLALAPVARSTATRGGDDDTARVDALLDAFPPRADVERVEDTLSVILRDPARAPATRARAVAALQRIGSPQAVETLRRFAESAPEPPTSLRAGVADPASALKLQALHALRDMKDTGVAPLVALLALQDSLPFSEDLKAEASRAADGVDPLIWAEYLLERSDYGAAYDKLSAAQQASTDEAYQQRVRNALAKVHLRRGLVALRRAELNPASDAYLSAAADLSAALSGGADEKSLQEAASYGLRLGFLLHETIALRDPDAFEESYRIFSSVAPLSRKVSDDMGVRVAADLAEAALTAGRYDEAYIGARLVIQELEARPSATLTNTALNMKLVALAALLLKKDHDGATRMLAALQADYDARPKGFVNEWEYSGTLHYLNGPNIPPQIRRTLRATIDRIMTPK
jgi:HEAT repeats/PBS lyase HEAT-like repeat